MRSFMRLRPWIDAAGRNEAGSTAIEFAFVIGPFLALLFAIMEVALIYFGQVSLDTQTENAARIIMTGQAQNSHMNQEQFKDLVCKDLVSFLKCDDITVDVRASNTFAEASSNLAQPLNADGTMASGFDDFTPGGPSKVVVVSVYCNFRLLSSLPALGDFTGSVGLSLGNMPDGSRLMSSVRAFRTEPYSVGP